MWMEKPLEKAYGIPSTINVAMIIGIHADVIKEVPTAIVIGVHTGAKKDADEETVRAEDAETVKMAYGFPKLMMAGKKHY